LVDKNTDRIRKTHNLAETPDLLNPSNNKFDPLPSFLLFAKQQICCITPDIVVFQAPGSTAKQQI
jgi:hypothetical protein